MKRLTRICTLLMALLLVLGMSTTAYAAGSVTYDGDARAFIFAPGTAESPTNLFENFQNVMPGDTITEEIVIKNDTSKNVRIKVYLRSLGAQEGTDDFLSQMNLTVKQKDESLLFDAPADETAQLTDWVYLGGIYSGGEITLELTLTVPVDMGNDFQNQVGYIDWEFKIEEFPVQPHDPKPPVPSDPSHPTRPETPDPAPNKPSGTQPPHTGDTNSVFLYAALLVVSLAAILLILLSGKRKKKSTDQ